MRIIALLVAVSLVGCASSRGRRWHAPPGKARPFICGTGAVESSIAMQAAIIVVPTLLIGGAVAAGYFAIGGEAPLR